MTIPSKSTLRPSGPRPWQALYYADRTGRKPGILLILEKDSDERHLARIKVLTEKYDIKLWAIEPE